MAPAPGEPGDVPAFPLRIAFDSLLAPRRPSPGGRADLWSLLPRELAPLLRPGMPRLVAEIRGELHLAIPALARNPDGVVGRAVTEGIHQALTQFLDRLEDPGAAGDERLRLFREMGSQQIYDGPILDVLQTAYRIGARVAWRRIAAAGEQAGVSSAALCLLAEAIFAYIDELSALSVEGHASARAREVGALERRRRQLLQALVSPGSGRPLAHLSEAARWPLPDRVRAVAVRQRDDAEPPVAAVDPRYLVDLESAEPCLVVAGPDVGDLAAELPGWICAVGPAVPVTECAQSLRWARRTLSLVLDGALRDQSPTWFDRSMSVLWLLNDPFLVREIGARVLAPLSALTGKQRDKLGETLLVWLETRRSAPEIAALLSIHPQTVRYRLRQLERLFGDGLADPDRRFDIEVALRAERALRGTPRDAATWERVR
ncbi:helix-turn-helix domain-containing protein [Actinokineospora guangxiensis]|uniref:PucR family transcriptional regulator n=1 Tax=Actinokineospora guangxiensis TaxID=1490288 RepID=UPI0036713493